MTPRVDCEENAAIKLEPRSHRFAGGRTIDYSNFVEHPRYGRAPRWTELQPGEIPVGFRLSRYVPEGRIDGTAVSADPDRQSYSPIPVLYYFDLKRTCLDCEQPFIFFAEEQKHWYETLGFSLDADCVRCTRCRKQQQGLEKTRRRYEELFHLAEPSAEEIMERVECSLDLIEAGVFHHRQTERVRSQLKKLQAVTSGGMKDRLAAAQKRVRVQGEERDGNSR